MIGRTISHYRIIERLGEGGMGVVYKAEDTKLGRTVALKFLPPELTRDAEAKKRFIQEARAASALDHPNICNVHEIDETSDGQTFIAMACYDGESLKAKIERGPLPLDEALDIAGQIAQGLAKAHGQGIVHRDIKPANILITNDGLVKIVDFGLAKLAGRAKLTKTGLTLGTAAYMSPEQARGEEVDARSDIFSLGAVLYEMLTGRRAFPGEYDQATLYAIMNEEPPPVTSVRSGVPMDLERIVKKALAKKAGDRYQDADDLIVDLKNVARESVRAMAQRAKPSGSRRARLASMIALSAALIVLAIAAILFIGRSRHESSQREKSVAVLPFTNMSGDKEDDFFSDGITEDIITQLSNIGEIKVISRTSVMQYKNTTKNLREIAKELGVATVLEGSVRRAGNQVRIVAQLIDASNDEHILAQTYDKEMTQIFAIQSDVAQRIAAALRAELSPSARERLAKKPTENLDAYAYYLKGREYYYRYTKRDNESAIELFKKALELDPRYALAYAGLGDAYADRVDHFNFPMAWADSSIAMSEKAIALDPNLAEGYEALGYGYHEKGWLNKSIETFTRAAEINSNYSTAVGNIGFCLLSLGRYDEALKWLKKAVSLNPMLPQYYVMMAMTYMFIGDTTKGMEFSNKEIALAPDFIGGLWFLGRVRLAQGEYQQAMDQALKILTVQPNATQGLNIAGLGELLSGDYAQAQSYFEKAVALDSTYGPTTNLGYVYLKMGRRGDAREMFARSLRRDEEELASDNENPFIPLDAARVCAVQGNKEESYKWLQKAIDGGWRGGYFWTAPWERDPLLDNIRNDDRFKQMMADVKAKVAEMRKRIEEMDKEEAAAGGKNQ